MSPTSLWLSQRVQRLRQAIERLGAAVAQLRIPPTEAQAVSHTAPGSAALEVV